MPYEVYEVMEYEVMEEEVRFARQFQRAIVENNEEEMTRLIRENPQFKFSDVGRIVFPVDSERRLFLEEQVRKAASGSESDGAAAIRWLSIFPQLDVNAGESVSGRTAFHMAMAQGNVKFASALRLFGADVSRRDNAGFTAFDLVKSDRRFQGAPPAGFYEDRLKQVHSVEEYFKAYSCPIVYVEDTKQLDSYIIQHPHSHQIGFLVDLPNVLKERTDDIDVVAIYFQRIACNLERFIIFGHILPLEIKTGIQRHVVWCPFYRTGSVTDHFLEAVAVLALCCKDIGFSDFCEKYSDKFNIAEPLTPAERMEAEAVASSLRVGTISHATLFRVAVALARDNFRKLSTLAYREDGSFDFHASAAYRGELASRGEMGLLLVKDVWCLNRIIPWMIPDSKEYSARCEFLDDLRNRQAGHGAAMDGADSARDQRLGSEASNQSRFFSSSPLEGLPAGDRIIDSKSTITHSR